MGAIFAGKVVILGMLSLVYVAFVFFFFLFFKGHAGCLRRILKLNALTELLIDTHNYDRVCFVLVYLFKRQVKIVGYHGIS